MSTLRDNPSDNTSLLSRDEHSPSNAASIQHRDSGEVGLSDPQAEENGSTTTSKHWIQGVYLCAEATGILLLINLALFATAAGLSRKYPGNSGLPSWATFYHGDCTLAERLEITLHLIINVLSTGILAASNYCMQTLVAPTREDIDKCHERREWLYVGRASLRNLLYIKRYRAGLWVVLMITATPFHLLYNSVITSIQSTSSHDIVVGPRDLESKNVLNLTTPALEKCFTSYSGNMTEGIKWHGFTQDIVAGNYEHLSSKKCSDMLKDDADSRMKLFVLLLQNFTVADGGDKSMLQISSDSRFAFAWGDWFLAAPFSNHTDGIQNNGSTVCNIHKTSDYTYSNSGDGIWSSMDTIQGCLAVKAQQNCQLLYSPPLCLIVTLTIFVKAMTILIAARVNRFASPPLLTTGDAISSFVSRPDSTTKNMCCMSSKDVRRGEWKKSIAFFGIVEDPAQGVPLQNIVYKRLTRQGRWMKASSVINWAVTFAISVACMVAGFFFIFGAKGTNISGPILDSYSLTGKSWGPLDSVILANTPQLVITVSYYFYNSVLTNMLAAAEYSSYSLRRKPLRVTWPVKDSEQQSTYWLSIPYKYGIPLLVVYTTLHWMISQSLFYYHHIPYDVHNQPEPDYEEKFLASSSLAVFLAIAIGSIMLCALFGLSLRKFKSTMPLAGACSAAISAACHPSKDEDLENISLRKVMWGEINASVGRGNDFDGIDDQKGHCGFTSMEAVKPNMKKLYA